MRGLGVLLGAVAGGVVLASTVSAAIVGAIFGGRIPCAEQSGVQFCQGSRATRVENVTLPPAAMAAPFPLIVTLHGWGQGTRSPSGAAPTRASSCTRRAEPSRRSRSRSR